MQVCRKPGRDREYTLAVLAFAFSEQLLEPLTEHSELRFVADEYLGALAAPQQRSLQSAEDYSPI